MIDCNKIQCYTFYIYFRVLYLRIAVTKTDQEGEHL